MNKNAIMNFMKLEKAAIRKSVFMEYLEDIKFLLEQGYSRTQVYKYLEREYRIEVSIKAFYKFLERHNLKPETNIDKIITQPEPIKAEEETKPKPKEPERKPEQKQIKSEEENPLTYEEYSRDYDEAEEVKGEDIYKHGFVFKKSTWEKITKEEFAEVVKYLQTHHIQFTKKEYYTPRKLKQKCLDENIDLRFYLMYIENIKDIDIKAKRGLNDRKVVSTLENFSKGFMVEKR